MSDKQKEEVGNKVKHYQKKLPLAFIILASLIPGAVIATILFVNAAIYDSKVQHARNALPRTDLSDVRIEGYTLGQYITDWNPKENFSTIICESGEKYYRRTYDTINSKVEGTYVHTERLSPLVFEGNSPIAYIEMYYPLIDPSWSFDNGVETWRLFTINGVPIPNYDVVVDALGTNYLLVEKWRSEPAYLVYVDYQNNLELRFRYFDGKINSIFLMKLDNRGFMDYIMNQRVIYNDAFYSSIRGNRIIYDYYIKTVVYEMGENFRNKEFLYPFNAYFSLLPYFAAWTFPLMWALFRRSIKTFIPIVAWYPLWYCFGAMIAYFQSR